MTKRIDRNTAPKVAVVADLFPTVSETFVMHHIAALIDLGYSVDIYAFEREALDKYGHSVLKEYGMQDAVRYLPKDLQGSQASVEFAAEAYTAVHCHFGDVARRIIPLIPSMPQTRFLVTYHGRDIRAGKLEPGRYIKVFEEFDYIISIGDFNRRALLGMGCNADKIIHSPNTVNTATFFPTGDHQADETLKILTVARLHRDKNIAYALRVMRRLLDRGLCFHYTVLGHGTEREALEAQIATNGLAGHVSLHGQASQEEVQKQLQTADIFFLPSRAEAAPVCLLEAQASGLPVVATRVGGVAEIVKDKLTGSLVDSDDDRAAVEAILQLASSTSLRQEWGTAARRYMEEDFDYWPVKRRLFSLYGRAPMPRVSVIIPTFNRAKYIGEALDSVLRQSYQCFEIIVVDDGSTDDTRSVIEHYMSRYPGAIHYHYCGGENAAAARNAGAALSRCEFLAFLDSDDIWYRDKLELQVSMLDEQPQLGFVHTNVDFYETEDYEPHGMLPLTDELATSSADLMRGDHQIYMTVLVRRQYFNKVGGFDPKLVTTHDTDLWLRLAALSELGSIDKPQVCVRLHNSHLSTSDPERKLRHRMVVIDRARELNLDQESDTIWRHRHCRTILELSRECWRLGKTEEAKTLARQALGTSPMAGRTLFVTGDTLRSKVKKLLKPYFILLRGGT